MNYSTVLFDMDETLFSSSASIKTILKELLLENNYDASNSDLDKYPKINSIYWKKYQNGEIDFHSLKTGRFSDFLYELNVDADIEEFTLGYTEKYKEADSLIEDALFLCSGLHKNGYKLYLASNGEDFVQRKRINKAGMASFFSGYFNSDIIGFCKPSIEYFNFIKENIDEKDPKKILMVGDSYSTDVEGAIRADMSGCWFCRKESEYSPDLPCITVRSLKELYNILLPSGL